MSENMQLALVRFRTTCRELNNDNEAEELDYYALSVGFFLACALDIDTSKKLAHYSRYTLQYWC